jgi:hypothetical protein
LDRLHETFPQFPDVFAARVSRLEQESVSFASREEPLATFLE